MSTDKKLLELSDAFDKDVKFLAKVCVARKKGTFDEQDALLSQRRMLTIMSTYPTYIIQTLGPHFLRHGQLINDGKFNELLSMNFENETKEYLQSDAAKKNDVNAQYVSQTMEFVKSVYTTSSPAEQQRINATMVNMLSNYAEFVMRDRSLRKK